MVSRWLANSFASSAFVFTVLGMVAFTAPNSAEASCASMCGGTCAGIRNPMGLPAGACAVGTCTGSYCTSGAGCTCAADRTNTACTCK